MLNDAIMHEHQLPLIIRMQIGSKLVCWFVPAGLFCKVSLAVGDEVDWGC